MSDKKEVLAIQLMDRVLQVKTSQDKADDLRKAAKLLNGKMREIQDDKAAVDHEHIALMAGLNLAYEVLNSQKQKDLYLESVNSRIKEIQGRLDENLAPKNEELF